MVAGETSGDLLGAHLLAGLQSRWPMLAQPGAAVGIGGAQMVKAGFDAWWPSEKLAVRGYVEVLRHYREIVGIRRQLRTRLLSSKPALFIGVDAPDFNLDLELELRRSGIKIVHFISPSVWAWRAERMVKIKAACDEVLCIFPFEPKLYEAQGMRATYVGHPLASVIPEQVDASAARTQLGLHPTDPVLALLPGSRQSEVAYLGVRMFAALALLLAMDPRLQCVVPCVPALKPAIERCAHEAGLGAVIGTRLKLLHGQSHAALAACNVTLIASGTATLEAALFKRPMVIVYNMHPLSWWLTARKRLQPWVGLPNILCESFVVPELLQDRATPKAMAEAAAALLADRSARERISVRFNQLHAQLKRDTVALACDAIEKIL